MITVLSRNNLLIRLTDERWLHIITEHAELTELKSQVVNTVGNPQRILAGNAGELFAVTEHEPGKWLVVIYREQETDGFIITAFLTRRTRSLAKRKQLWP